MKRQFTLAGILCLLAIGVSLAQGVSGYETTSDGNFEDGTFILNEGWFGHDGGSINFITADGDIMYNVQQNEEKDFFFGNTSCCGTVYGGKLYVMSKQANGESGRLVVMDAKTLKLLKSVSELNGGDGRSVVGVNPHKVYLGTSTGVVTFDVDNMQVGDLIQGTYDSETNSRQTGDMVKAGRYVFALQQGTGVHVIDTETDMTVETIEDADVQGIAQSADGNVWIASKATLTCVDPATLEVVETLTLPEGAQIMCQWGSWRPTAFCASRKGNVLYWNKGGSWSGGNEFYRYEIGTDINGLQPFFTLEGLPGSEDGKKQEPYGTIGFDDRTGQLLVLTTQSGYGTNYEHNWIHFVNGETGELEKSVKTSKYYWFQEQPVFPDKYAPEFTGVEGSVDLDDNGLPYTIDMAGKVADRDNIDYNIRVSLADGGDAEVADARLEGSVLTVAPVAAGETKVVLAAESNGVVTEWPITVRVSNASGIGVVGAAGGDATETARYTLDGQLLDAPQPGVNIVHMSDGTVKKVVVKR